MLTQLDYCSVLLSAKETLKLKFPMAFPDDDEERRYFGPQGLQASFETGLRC